MAFPGRTQLRGLTPGSRWKLSAWLRAYIQHGAALITAAAGDQSFRESLGRVAGALQYLLTSSIIFISSPVMAFSVKRNTVAGLANVTAPGLFPAPYAEGLLSVARREILILIGFRGSEAGPCLCVLLIDTPKPWLGGTFEFLLLFSFMLANYRLSGEAPSFCRSCKEQL